MLDINIPGVQPLRLTHLILDYNGTLARDGSLLEGVAERLEILAKHLEIHIVTADTFGSVRTQVAGLPVQLAVIPPDNQAQAKAAYIENLGPANSVAIGNGRNDALMLKQAALGIAVVQTEGAATEALLAAEVVTPGIVDALDLLLSPDRLKATLRL
ncbi:MAG: HAD hydrolase family protein [Proteobacteria bacterium]|nr:HAD hydrolase family protein [Pseudomonadota bacterium]MBU4355963.1 HAD hydrolase family protein [Pseudomonadota bacterium]MBU4448912.1 HAD hydrolase family protein [Pseudomonadota bacterium]MCG2772237.1 HAD hydrolase family protein [Desulfobacterales bacterium]